MEAKTWKTMQKRTLLRARATMLRCVLDLANAIRGALRTFGISLPAGSGNGGAKTFERRVVDHLVERPDLDVIVSPLLEAWRAGRAQVARQESAIRRIVRNDPRCQLLMTVPGVGYLTAVGYVGAIGDPATFKSGRTVAAWIGLTPRRYQSGAMNQQGRISRQGDKLLRAYLYEAAAHILTRSKTDSALRRWGLRLRERIGFKRANVAVARKLAVILHAIWRSGRPFEAEGSVPA